MHLARLLKDAGRHPGIRQPALGMGRGLPVRLREPRVPMTGDTLWRVVSSSTDDAIVAGVRAGDEAVFALLLSDWSRSMLMVARTFVSTEASAEEVVQDTWLAVIRGIDGFEGRSSLRTWVYRILVHTAKRRGIAREPRRAVGQPGPRRIAVRRSIRRSFATTMTNIREVGSRSPRNGTRPRAASSPVRCVPTFAPRSTRCQIASSRHHLARRDGTQLRRGVRHARDLGREPAGSAAPSEGSRSRPAGATFLVGDDGPRDGGGALA